MTELPTRVRAVTCGSLPLSLLFALLPVILLSAGCQTATVEEIPEPEVAPVAEPDPEPAPVLTLNNRERLRLALEHLQEGRSAEALDLLRAYRENVPDSRIADQLIRQIETPIADYFPQEAFAVTLAEGESLSSIAQKYLGDALEFFALARYNDLDRPAQVRTGQQIRIPATERAAAVFAQRREAADAVVDGDTQPPSATVAQPRDRTAAADGQAAAKLAASESREAEGDLQGAYALALEASELEPDNDVARARLAALSPRVVEARYREAVAAFSRQDLDATIQHANAVLAIDPGHTNAQVYKVRAEELKAKLQELYQNR
ncbi:MAG: LysM peptidoglycan-binding domain-containing protein [Pseudomonadales bacterium]|nr:LysM peptidoglycan-binding domain-containing protein [Pseudomonadales bacterium]